MADRRPTQWLPAALVAAVVAQWLVDVGASSAGAAVFIGAVSAAVYGRNRGVAGAIAGPSFRPPETASASTTWGLGGVLVAATAVALCFDVRQPHVAFWWLHGATIVAALGLTMGHDRKRTDPVLTSVRSGPQPIPRPMWAVLVLVVVAVSVGFRLYDLTSLPQGFWFDEAVNANVAQAIYSDGYRPLWESGTFDAPAHHGYLIAVLLRLGFGSIGAVRGVSVVFGLAAIAGAYVVGRELWGQIGALSAMALVGLSRWPVTVSRIGMFNVVTPACLLVGLGLTLVGLRRDHLTYKMLGGMTLGFGVAFHSSMAFAVAGVGLFLLTLVRAGRPALRALWVPAAGVAILAAPVVGIVVRDFDLYNERPAQVSLFNSEADDKVGALGSNARDVLGMFTVAGDMNGRHNIPGEPLLDPVAGGLLVLGLGLAFGPGERRQSSGLIGWGLLALVPGVVTLSSEAPNALRVIGAMPVVFLVGAGVLARVLQLRTARVASIAMVVLVAALSGWTMKDYFNDWRDDSRVWAAHSVGETIAAQTASRAGDDVLVYTVGEFFHSPVGEVLAPGAFDRVIDDDDIYPLSLTGDEDVVLIVGQRNGALVGEYRHVFGDAVVTEYRRQGEVGATVIELRADAIRARQGLTATYRTSGQPSAEAVTRDERTPGSEPVPVPLPAEATWQGLMVVDNAGTYGFSVGGAAQMTLVVNGMVVDPNGMWLEKGPHYVVISGLITGDAGAVDVRWQPPDQQMVAIPASQLWLAPLGPAGLMGESYEGLDGSGPRSRARFDAAVDFTIGQPDAARPRQLEWSGYLDVPQDGLYVVGVESAGTTQLWFDGRLVDDSDASMLLTQGLHALRFTVVDRGPGTHVRLAWNEPGDAPSTIPSTALVPPWALTNDEQAEVDSGTPQFVSVDPEIVELEMSGAVAVGSANGHIVVASDSGEVAVLSGGREPTELHLGHAVSDIGVGPNGRIIALDPAGRVVALDLSGESAVLAEDTRLASARGIDVDESGRILVAGTAANLLFSLDEAGQLQPVALVTNAGQPVDALLVDANRVVVIDADPAQIRLVRNGVTEWAVPLLRTDTIQAPHVARYGDRLFVTDPPAGQVLELSMGGVHVATYDLQSTETGRARPQGIAVAEDGTVWVVDTASGAVLGFRPE